MLRMLWLRLLARTVQFAVKHLRCGAPILCYHESETDTQYSRTIRAIARKDRAKAMLLDNYLSSIPQFMQPGTGLILHLVEIEGEMTLVQYSPSLNGELPAGFCVKT